MLRWRWAPVKPSMSRTQVRVRVVVDHVLRLGAALGQLVLRDQRVNQDERALGRVGAVGEALVAGARELDRLRGVFLATSRSRSISTASFMRATPPARGGDGAAPGAPCSARLPPARAGRGRGGARVGRGAAGWRPAGQLGGVGASWYASRSRPAITAARARAPSDVAMRWACCSKRRALLAGAHLGLVGVVNGLHGLSIVGQTVALRRRSRRRCTARPRRRCSRCCRGSYRDLLRARPRWLDAENSPITSFLSSSQ